MNKKRWNHAFGMVGALVLAVSCSAAPLEESDMATSVSSSALTAGDRLTACAQDPRVIAGLVTKEICAGADIFFRETFSGNGRTCGTCHRIENNTTIDPTFISALRASNPKDPLFVFERDPNLAALEDSNDINLGGVRENVDGFEDPTHKFVVRGVPHVLSLATSIAADKNDGTTIPPVERTGWSGDGAPNDGSLRSFLGGAVKQHYTKTLARRPGVDFRPPTSQESDLVLAFQLSLGRLNDPNLSLVTIFDPEASAGQQAFMDPNRGRCNVCHFNAGASFQFSGKNHNFDTQTRLTSGGFSFPTFDGKPLLDGGFGGTGLAHPNVVTDPNASGGANDGFGNNTFNVPPLVEAADTGPFFHNNSSGPSIESAVAFYAGAFNGSPADLELQGRFGTPLNVFQDIGTIGRFLRALNTALNLDMAEQRLSAALTLAQRFPRTRVDIQLGLLNLAEAELNDALRVLTDANTSQPFYPVSVDRIGLAKSEIAAARTATSSSRAGHISTAFSRVQNARDQIGDHIFFGLGQGNLMF